MVILAIVVNCIISLLGFYVAWRVWQLRRVLANIATVVNLSERDTYAVLHGAPAAIRQGQIGASTARSQYSQLAPQVQQLQQSLSILTLLLNIGQQLKPRWLRLKARRKRRK